MDEAPGDNADAVDIKSAGSHNTTPSLQKIYRKGDKIYHANDENVTMINEADDQSRQSNDLTDCPVDPISSGESLYKTFAFDDNISKEETDKCIMFWRSVVEKNLEPIKCTIIEDLNKSKRDDSEKKDKEKAKKKTKAFESSPKEAPKRERKGVWSNILDELQKTRLHKTKLLLEKRCRICEYTTGTPYETDNAKELETHLKELDEWQPKSNRPTSFSGSKSSTRKSTDSAGIKKKSSGLKNQRQQSNQDNVKELTDESIVEIDSEQVNDPLLMRVKEASNKIEYIDAIEKKKREQIYSKWRQNKVEELCGCSGVECDCNTNPAVVAFNDSRDCTGEMVKECEENNQSLVPEEAPITIPTTNKLEDTDGSKRTNEGEMVKESEENNQSLVPEEARITIPATNKLEDTDGSKRTHEEEMIKECDNRSLVSEDGRITIPPTNKQEDTDGSKRTHEVTILEVQELAQHSSVEIIELDTNNGGTGINNEDPNGAGSYKLETDDADDPTSKKSGKMQW